MKVINTAYGVSFNNFEINYEDQKGRLVELCKNMNSYNGEVRFIYKHKDKPGCYVKLNKKKIPKR